MKNFEKTTELLELSKDEMMSTQGGESAWYWIANGVGGAVRAYLEIIHDDSYSTPIA